MPHGGLFAYVSCANYLGELVQWGGWALATWSYAGLLWWLFALSTFVPRARDTHAWYALLPLASTLLLMFINASCARISTCYVLRSTHHMTAFDVYNASCETGTGKSFLNIPQNARRSCLLFGKHDESRHGHFANETPSKCLLPDHALMDARSHALQQRVAQVMAPLNAVSLLS